MIGIAAGVGQDIIRERVKIMKDRVPAVLIVLGLLIYTVIIMLIFDTKYNNDYTNLKALNKEQQHLINSYATKELEHQCECGVSEYENGYIIDGAYYEYKEVVE